MVKNPNWQETDQLAIYKRGRGVELGATEKQLQLAVRAGLESGTSGFQVRLPLTTRPCCLPNDLHETSHFAKFNINKIFMSSLFDQSLLDSQGD